MAERAVDVAGTDHRRLRLAPSVVGDAHDVHDAAEFFVAVERERERSRRSRLACSLLVMTVDESAAARVAQILRDTLRQIDVVGRIDRTRIAVLLPYTTEEDACSLQDALTREFDPLGVDVAWGIDAPRTPGVAIAEAGRPDGVPLRLVPRPELLEEVRRSSSSRPVKLLVVALALAAFVPIAWMALAR